MRVEGGHCFFLVWSGSLVLGLTWGVWGWWGVETGFLRLVACLAVNVSIVFGPHSIYVYVAVLVLDLEFCVPSS